MRATTTIPNELLHEPQKSIIESEITMMINNILSFKCWKTPSYSRTFGSTIT